MYAAAYVSLQNYNQEVYIVYVDWTDVARCKQFIYL